LSEFNVLFIVMEFVPLNLGGVFRPLRFVNGLEKNNIHPVIVTFQDNAHLRKVQSRFDYKLLEKLDKNIRVYRVPLADMDKYQKTRIARIKNIYFNATDNYLKAWKENLFQQLPEIIKKHRPKAVFVTCPPFSGAELGMYISKKFKIPLILDMRDAWSKLSMGPLGSYLHYAYKRNMEHEVFKQASAIISVTPQLLNVFRQTHADISPDKFHLIYNGFDFELPESLSVQSGKISEKGTIHIGYIGSFYYFPWEREMMLKPWWKKKGHRMLQYTPVKEDWLYRSPYFLLRSLANLFAKRPEFRTRIFFHHVGDTPEWLPSMADELGVKNNIVLHGFQTHAETLKLQSSFDLLLATSEKVIGNDHYCLPSKLFTYLGSGKPLLGFVTRGIQHDFILQSGLGVICDPDKEDDAVNIIDKIITEGYTKDLNISYLRQFDNSRAISGLKALIEQTVADN
jgi:glycosyltransferase involved in cell wall biosynthesis